MKIRVICNDNWANKDFVLEKVKQDGFALEYASEELRNDKEVVLAAVKQRGDALRFASWELKNNRHIAFEAVINDWNAYCHASFEIQKAIQELLKNNLN